MFKTFPAQLASITRTRRGRRNLGILTKYFSGLAVLLTVFTIIFHELMAWEGKEYSWITGFYWTLTVMSTLGFGDITFSTDVGRLFSIIVLGTGTIFLLVLLPFTFIEFFYEPWMNAQAAARAPRDLPSDTKEHVLLIQHDAITSALIRRLEQHERPYALIVADVEEALRMHDLGLNVMVGDLDDPETWARARAEEAAMVVCTANDFKNTSVAFTVRAYAPELPIMTTASDEASLDILKLAGSSFVFRLERMIGQSFARRTLSGDAKAHVIGRFDQLLIAEATAHRTPLVGKCLADCKLREIAGVTVVGVWVRGKFEQASSTTLIQDNTVLVLAGTKQQLVQYDEFFCIYNNSAAPVLIIGGGRVGRATAAHLARRKIDYRIIESLPERIHEPEKYVLGSAADLATLEKAGIREASTVVITTHDDDVNVYLTIYCRQLRPDIQILCRATNDRNVATLHRAEADTVLSYASMGANAIMNYFEGNKIVMVAEGLELFRVTVPDELAGESIAESKIRERTGCSVAAIYGEQGMIAGPVPTERLLADTSIVLIGTPESEQEYLELFGKGDDDGNSHRFTELESLETTLE